VTKASTFEKPRAHLENPVFDITILGIPGIDGKELRGLTIKKNAVALMGAAICSPEHTVTSFRKGAAFFVPKEEMGNIEIFLNDVLEAKEKGHSLLGRRLEGLDGHYTKVLVFVIIWI
jgi:hypothetical protein